MQHDFEITTADANTGPSMRAAINEALQALASGSLGLTEPGTPYAGQFWADITSGLLKQRNSGNTAWVERGNLDDDWSGTGLESSTDGTLAGNSDDVVPTEKAIKTYVDIGRIITDTTLYLATTGDDTTGDGSSGTPWYSLEKVFDYLKNKWINTDVTVTISVGDGTYTGLNTVYVRHPQAANISVEGVARSTTILTFIAGEDGINIAATKLGMIKDITLKGDSATSDVGIRVTQNGAICSRIILLDTWLIGMKVIEQSYAKSTSGFFTSNTTNGLIAERSFVDLQGGPEIDCNNLASSYGIKALDGANITTGFADVANAIVGYYASNNSYMDADSSSCTNCTSDYDPAITTGDTPSFGNVGSWIYKP